jgi:chitin disaccharide deacetylase
MEAGSDSDEGCRLHRIINAFPQGEAGDHTDVVRRRKFLVIHADDFGMSDSVNQATIVALEQRGVSSASVMVPCRGFEQAAAYASAHKEHDIGVHLTLTSEWTRERWGPVASPKLVPSLIDPAGFFWPDPRQVVQRARAEEVERELICQIERAMNAGMSPTHLDMHMFTLLLSRQMYAVYVGVARRFRIPFIALDAPQLRHEIVVNSIFSGHEGIPDSNWTAAHIRTLQTLEVGVSQLITHVGFDNMELKQITGAGPWGSKWRQRDLDLVMSSEFRDAIKRNHLTVVGWSEASHLRRDFITPSSRIQMQS